MPEQEGPDERLRLPVDPQDRASAGPRRWTQVEKDLEQFKSSIEARGAESGAWRGQVDQDPTS